MRFIINLKLVVPSKLYNNGDYAEFKITNRTSRNLNFAKIIQSERESNIIQQIEAFHTNRNKRDSRGAT